MSLEMMQHVLETTGMDGFSIDSKSQTRQGQKCLARFNLPVFERRHKQVH